MAIALLLIDLQQDFCAGGALAVAGGDEVIAVANQAIALFQQARLPILASKDWHPADHQSFASQAQTVVGTLGQLHGLPQVWWPDHCIQDSAGSQFHPALNAAAIEQVVYKGQHQTVDSYSAFFDNGHRYQTDLQQQLRQRQVDTLVIMGLATDYCVQYTVLDALDLGYQVWLLLDGCRGVNLQPQDAAQALAQMQAHGAELITLAALAQRLTPAV